MKKADKQIRRRAEQEARRRGYEVRPTVVRDTREQRRLAQGFAILGWNGR